MESTVIILHVSELIACITGFIFLKKLNNSFFRYFPFYLLFIVLSEAAGYLLKISDMKMASKLLFNYIVIPVEFLFFYLVFYFSLANKRYKKLPLLCMVIYILCWMIDILFIGNMKFWFYSFSYTVGNLLLLVLIFRFYFNLITTSDVLYFKSNQLFWISGGLLIFYLGTFPYYSLLNTIAYNQPGLHSTYRHIVIILNILMYLMFTFSFIWGKQNTKYSSS